MQQSWLVLAEIAACQEIDNDGHRNRLTFALTVTFRSRHRHTLAEEAGTYSRSTVIGQPWSNEGDPSLALRGTVRWVTRSVCESPMFVTMSKRSKHPSPNSSPNRIQDYEHVPNLKQR